MEDQITQIDELQEMYDDLDWPYQIGQRSCDNCGAWYTPGNNGSDEFCDWC